MKSAWSGAWLVGGFGLLIIAAFLVVAQKPPELIPMDAELLKNSPMPVLTSSLPVLAPAMPEFAGITRWWNTEDGQPLTPEKLKGKVVMIDFWTYSCINCIRTQPFMRKIWDTYKDDGLVIVGVHTPEFAFEKEPGNVERAFKEAGLEYPIALDPDYLTWRAYNNRYWPAAYFFDRQGRLRFTHFGEGDYDRQEGVIRTLLAESGEALEDAPTGGINMPAFSLTKTPETYFGYARMKNFANKDELKRDEQTTYSLRDVGPDEWSVGGPWGIESERAIALAGYSTLRFNIESNAFHLVMGSSDGRPKRVSVTLIDEEIPAGQTDLITADMFGENLRDDPELTLWVVDVTNTDLYRVLRFPAGGRHTVEIQALDPGVEFYAATFGE